MSHSLHSERLKTLSLTIPLTGMFRFQGDNKKSCVRLPTGNFTNDLTCLPNADTAVPAAVCPAERMRWLWTLFLVVATPYFFVFFRNSWICSFKRKRSPNCVAFFVVSLSSNRQQMSCWTNRKVHYLSLIVIRNYFNSIVDNQVVPKHCWIEYAS